jgi:hypothetical protein
MSSITENMEEKSEVGSSPQTEAEMHPDKGSEEQPMLSKNAR